MFERYTEKARRILFFARYEASRYGSPAIETEHLLLGLLRETRAIFDYFLTTDTSEESFRKQIGGTPGEHTKLTPDANLPLSGESKKVLTYAAEEADRMDHQLIGPEHLFLGLLCEQGCFAARMLKVRGADIRRIRKEMMISAHSPNPAVGHSATETMRQQSRGPQLRGLFEHEFAQQVETVPSPAEEAGAQITGPLRIDLYKVQNPMPWGLKLRRLVWHCFQLPFFEHTPRMLSPLRVFLLRLFGAKIGPACHISGGVRIWMPWNLTIGERSAIGFNTEIYNFAPVEIGDHVVVSQHSYICTSTHDYTHPYFPLVSMPILIDSQSWVAAGSFLGPGVTIGEGAVIGAKSVVTKSMPPWMVCAGNPCKPIKPRTIRTV